MWSLYKKKEGDSNNNLGEGIFSYSGDKLDPLKFSNGKTQADVVKEVLKAIEMGNKTIFIKGVCGSGKSALALNLARHFKKTSIVVPIKSLQQQYEEDYTHKKFILKDDNKKLKISVIKGRNNFRCPFLGERADDEFLPCTIELKDKNIDEIKKFIELNESVSKFDFSSISDVRRMSVAPACPYWSPILPAELNTKALDKANKKKYISISGKEYAIYQRKKGCPYYDQYEAYLDSDVLIFNSQKYLLEGIMGRKPKTDLDIIDECDEFLDNFSTERKINLNRLVMALSSLNPQEKERKDDIKEIIFMVNDLLFDEKEEGIRKIEETPVEKLLTKIASKPYLADDEEENYYNKAYEIAKEFEYFLDETYCSFSKENTFFGEKNYKNTEQKEGNTLYLNLVTINLAKRFEELQDKTEVLVLMSGTLHSEEVLRDIFGLKDFVMIDAETINPGTITKHRMGFERNCKFENFKNQTVTRAHYLKSLNACVENAKKPVLVHVNSFEDLPSELEKSELKLNYIISKEKIKTIQGKDNREIDRFKAKEIDVLFTTKCSRGVDFPGDTCNSIVITKFPYPNIQSLFWQILRKEKPEKFTEFYVDKANRELLQKIYRGLRFKEDHIILLSPDSRVLDAKI